MDYWDPKKKDRKLDTRDPHGKYSIKITRHLVQGPGPAGPRFKFPTHPHLVTVAVQGLPGGISGTRDAVSHRPSKIA